MICLGHLPGRSSAQQLSNVQGQRPGAHVMWSQLIPVPIRWLCRAVLVDAHASGCGGGVPAVWGLTQEVSGPSQPGVRSSTLF